MRYIFPMSLEVKKNDGSYSHTFMANVVAHDRDEAQKEFSRIMGLGDNTEGVIIGDGSDWITIEPYDEA